MIKYFTNNFPIINLYKKPNKKSEVVTQMIYGESFSVSKKTKKWFKISIKEDNYKGYIQKKNFSKYIRPTHKVNTLKAKVYKLPNKNKIKELPFGSKIKVINSKKIFVNFLEGGLIKKISSPYHLNKQTHSKK